MEFISKNIGETAKIAFNFSKNIASIGDKATVIGLYGELGSGKTTFMKYLAKNLGIKETIQSPTFVIMKKYDVRSMNNEAREEKKFDNFDIVSRNSYFDFLIHVDAYRIESEAEMLNLGWQEIISDPKNLICIEWPERIAKIMPGHTKIFFKYGDDENERKVVIEPRIKNYESSER